MINASGGEEEEELDDEAAEENEVASNTVVDSGRQASAVVASNVIVHGLGASFPVDIATDALQHELSENLRNQHLLSSPPDADEHDGLMEEAGAAGNSTYAQNLDLQLQEQDDVLPVNFRSDQDPRGFFQSEPTLLGIASGGYEAMSPPAELMGREAELVLSSPGTPNTTAVDSPPSWVPDSSAPNCMGCGEQFTLFKRRHHCRYVLMMSSKSRYSLLTLQELWSSVLQSVLEAFSSIAPLWHPPSSKGVQQMQRDLSQSQLWTQSGSPSNQWAKSGHWRATAAIILEPQLWNGVVIKVLNDNSIK